MLTEVTVEAALNAELEHYLGYQKNERRSVGNSRNGYSSKRGLTPTHNCVVNLAIFVRLYAQKMTRLRSLIAGFRYMLFTQSQS